MKKHNFVTIADLTREKILYMIEMAEEFEKHLSPAISPSPHRYS